MHTQTAPRTRSRARIPDRAWWWRFIILADVIIDWCFRARDAVCVLWMRMKLLFYCAVIALLRTPSPAPAGWQINIYSAFALAYNRGPTTRSTQSMQSTQNEHTDATARPAADTSFTLYECTDALALFYRHDEYCTTNSLWRWLKKYINVEANEICILFARSDGTTTQLQRARIDLDNARERLSAQPLVCDCIRLDLLPSVSAYGVH